MMNNDINKEARHGKKLSVRNGCRWLRSEKTGGIDWPGITAAAIVSVMALGLIHTGLGFYLFFTGMKGLNGQSIATLSYIDPIPALLVSYLIFGEVMNAVQMLGAVLLLGATFLGEYKTGKNQELVSDK